MANHVTAESKELNPSSLHNNVIPLDLSLGTDPFKSPCFPQSKKKPIGEFLLAKYLQFEAVRKTCISQKNIKTKDLAMSFEPIRNWFPAVRKLGGPN